MLTERKKNFLLFGLLFVLWFATINSFELLKNDEGRYAEIPREMLEQSDFVTPRLNGIKYFEKPPLQYWMTAAFYVIFGEREWTSRLWTELTGFLTILAVFLYLRSWKNNNTGIMAALVLASAPLFIAIGHINVLDMGLTLFLTLTMLSILKFLRKDISAKEKLIFNLIFWSSLGFSLLSKGLISFLLPCMVSFFYILIKRDLVLLKNINWVWGPLLFSLISVPWFVLVSLRNPEFPHFFFIHEHFERFTSSGHGRTGPIWYFIPLFLVGFLPWTSALFVNVKSILIKDGQDQNEKLFLWLWTFLIVLFFSISSSKLPHYILPVFPAIAMLVAMTVTADPEQYFKRIWSGIAFFTIAGMVAYFFLSNKSSDFIDQVHYKAFARDLFIYSSLTFVALVGIFIFRKKLKAMTSLWILGFVCLGFFQLAYLSYKALTPSVTGYRAAMSIIPHLDHDIKIFSVGDYEQSIPFYTKRKMVMVNYSGELQFGLNAEKIYWYPAMEEFLQDWNSFTKGIIFVTHKTLYKIQPIMGSLEEIYRDNQFLVYKKK